MATTTRDRSTNQSAAAQEALREQVRKAGKPADTGQPATEDTEDTEVGNYFVANYPPFSFWQREQVPAVEQLLEQPSPRHTPLGLYYHIPFCRKRCHFCYFRVYTDKNAAEIRRYLDATIRELEWYASRPYIEGRSLDYIYFGGGTPSYLSPSQLHDISSRMKQLLPWDEAREIAFECEPGTLNEKKLEAIRAMGVTRLSLGVENFDDHILELNGRAHRSGEIERAYRHARAIGFPQINIDLIAGMMDETEDNWRNSVDQAIALDPDMVTIYQMEVPYNTTIYKEMQETGRVTAPVANWATKRRWVSEAFDRFERAGYTVTSAYTVVKNPDQVKFVYRDALWEGADLLPIGVASFGHLGGMHLQNHHDIIPYVEHMEAGGPHSLYRAYGTVPDERFVREFILKLKLGNVSLSYYQDKFGIDPRQRFADQLEKLQQQGHATIDGDRLIMSRDGLLQVDRLLHDFFLPHHRHARYT